LFLKLIFKFLVFNFLIILFLNLQIKQLPFLYFLLVNYLIIDNIAIYMSILINFINLGNNFKLIQSWLYCQRIFLHILNLIIYFFFYFFFVIITHHPMIALLRNLSKLKSNLKVVTYGFFYEIINNSFISHVLLFENFVIFDVVLC
jgi:hypothetical protein